MVILDMTKGLNHIGRLGENEHRTFRFPDSCEVLAMYPEATVSVLVKRPGDSVAYPVAPGFVEIRNGAVYWTVQSADLARIGRGNVELTFVDGTTVAKNIIYDTYVDRALDGAGDPPEPWESWQTDIAQIAGEIAHDRAEAGQAAEDAAEAQRGAEVAQGAAESAVRDAEGSAGDAASSARAAGQSVIDAGLAQDGAEEAQRKAETAQGKAEDAQSGAEEAQGKAETAKREAEEAAEAAATSERNAAGSVTDAAAQVELAKKYVDGKGTDGTVDPAFNENNAKYYAQLTADAETVATRAIQAKGEEVLESIPADYTELSGDVENVKNILDNNNKHIVDLTGTYDVYASNFELGNIAYSNGEIKYYDNTKRVRTKQGITYHLSAGVNVGLSTYSGYRLYVGGSASGSGWLNKDYTIPAEDDYFILLRMEPETDIQDITSIVSLLKIHKADNEIANLKDTIGTTILSSWIYRKVIRNDGNSVDLESPVAANAYRYLVEDCSPGDAFVLNAKSGNASYRPWCFVDAQGNVLTVSSQYILTVDNYIVKAPANASKLIINDNSLTSICYAGYTLLVVADKANQIDKIEGKSNTFNVGQYYWTGGTTPGTSAENVSTANSSVRMCCMITLPAKKILRIVGRINTTENGTRVWRSYNQTTGKLNALAPSTTDIVSAYLCYDFDAHVYFNTMIEEDYYFGIIDQESPFYEIYKNHVEQKTSIMELNGRENVLYSLKTLRRPVRGKTRPFILAHFSDIHADPLNTPRVGEFFAETSGLIDAKISTGDMVYQSLDDGMDFWDESNLSDVLLAIGNHECATGTQTVVYENATPQAVYEEVMASRISGWSVTQPENAESEYLSYYYKDYATWKIRLVVLDLNHDSTYLLNQLTWFESVLSSAKASGYSVICASHYQFNAANNPTIVPCSFSLREGAVPQATNNWFIPATYETAVDDFIDGGGEFICWLGGHTHQDFVLLNSTGKQLCITVTTENFSLENAWSFGDDYRERYHRSQDAFNILGIDTYSKNISIFRIGNNLSRLMNSRNHLSINYANRTILFDD